MELPKETISTLMEISNGNVFSDEAFSSLLETVTSNICDLPTAKDVLQVCPSKPDVAKSAFVHVAYLCTEAARHDYSKESLETYLQSIRVTGSRAQKLCEAFAEHKASVQSKLERIGDGLPHIVDADWQLDYCVKTDTENSVGLPVYHVWLSTKKYGELKHLTFSCTVQQLQDLVYKLKDAVRHVEKISNA